MLGQQPSGPGPQEKQANMAEALRAEVGRIHQLISQVETMARAHPEAASHFQRAISSLGQAIQTVTQTMTRGQEGPRPPVLG